MNDQELRKLNRRFTIFWWLLGILIVLVLLDIALRPRGEVHHFVGEKGEPGQSITGPAGPIGNPGEDGATILHTEKVIVNQPTPGPAGPAGPEGPQGLPGANGRDIELQRNPETDDIEWRNKGDRFWQTLMPACELRSSCGATNGPGAD